MNLATILRRCGALFVLMLMMAATATAQRGRDDAGEFQILQARYGTAQHNVDVTQQLRQLARQDQRFKLVNDVFGVDPDPGKRKTLRIFARGRDGAQRTFEYQEYSQVDGSQFAGWARGDWGQGGWSGGWGGGDRPQARDDDGQYQILQASYGSPRNYIDVTQQLKELARRDRSFRLGNDTFGQDPDPGKLKMLRIHARGKSDGRSRTFEYREGALVDGAQFTGWSRGDWGPGRGGEQRLSIVSASYGANNRKKDVTARLRERIQGNRLSVRVDNDLAGTDPAPGRRKTLWVTYKVGNERPQQVQVDERGTLSIP